jgi:ATP-dependent helicase HrpA/adenine-specific DNA-methyltransferase
MSADFKRLRHNPTEAERLFWKHVRNKQLGCKFRRQVPIDQYVVDFLCFEKQLIVEIDGGQHTEERDAARTAHLEKRGYTVIRFWNHEVLGNIDGVMALLAQKA